jgi:transcriptional regulator with XRE-family HTH domain
MKQSVNFNEASVGKRISALRKAKKYTLEKLATKTRFTQGYLSKVEKSVKAPPVSTLVLIAHALDVSISTLLVEDIPLSPVSIVKKAERPIVHRNASTFEYSYEALAHNFKNKIMEPFILTLPVHPKKSVPYKHEGQEILYVLEGTMKLRVGEEVLIAEEGDCVYFDSGIPHFGESMGNTAAKCLMVISNSGAS